MVGPELSHVVWEFLVPPEETSSDWPSICRNFRPARTFKRRGEILTVSQDVNPSPEWGAHKVQIRFPSGKAGKIRWFGRWDLDSVFMEQYGWKDNLMLLQTSTGQLRKMQTASRFRRHIALNKWENQLNVPIPENIWMSTWLAGRSVCENAFLWQLMYRVIATQRWHFPGRLTSDASTWCSRCLRGVQEDVFHCIWDCTVSRTCWRWCGGILGLASRGGLLLVNLDPAQIFIGEPLPENWHIPDKLWQFMRAIVCWQIWKDRNAHFIEGQRSDPEKVIHTAWHRLGIYLRVEWRALVKQIKSGKIRYGEAELAMQSQFGSNPALWNIHELTLEVPPVPPRPP